MNTRTTLIAVLAIAGMVYAFYAFTKTPVDSTSLNIILTICSAALSWVISDYFASEQNTIRIDGVGERSSEKILNQSKQLWEIERSLLRQADEVEDYYASRELVAAQEKIQLIRSSNNTFIGDWEGLVSEPVQTKMAERNDALNKLFQSAGSGEAMPQPPTANLPSHLTPSPSASKLTTVIEQNCSENSGSISKGQFRVKLNRETYKFNFTGKFDPHLDAIPQDLRARIVSRPSGAPSNMGIHVNTGTNTDFHIHTKSNDYDVLLPTGEYVFDYIVRTEDPNAHEYEPTKAPATEPNGTDQSKASNGV
jgi:hypothetical protein